MTGKTPYDPWCGRRPSVHHLHIFGCVVHVKTARPNLKKLEDRSTPMVLFGYDPAADRVHVSRDVIFDEDAVWDWTSTGERYHGLETFALEHFAVPPTGDGISWNTTHTESAPDTHEDNRPASAEAARSPTPPATPSMPSPPTEEFVCHIPNFCN